MIFSLNAQNVFYSILCLIPAILVSGLCIALQILGRLQGKEKLQNSVWFPFLKLFYRPSHPKSRPWDILLFSLHLTKLIYYLLFGLISFHWLFPQNHPDGFFYLSSGLDIALVITLLLSLELILSRCIETRLEMTVKLLAFPVFLLLLPLLPLLFLYFHIKNFLTPNLSTSPKLPFRLQDKILDYLAESELNDYLDKNEKKLIHTFLSFKDRIVREVMVPRVDVFSLSSDISIQEAAKLFSQEGYSRIPVYKDNVDKIIGVLLYKDVLSIYTRHIENKEPPESLKKPVEQIVKPVLYTPETKKIALLLQEFKSKQIHLAIVVDEYGGTEGIVTIEDILEELVGNIEDEYDTQEEKNFSPLSSGGWIVDAKTSILDLEEHLNLSIPHSAEYDTLGGFIFHKAGSIPARGWKLHLDEIDLEVIRSDERSIQKIKITTRAAKLSKKPS